MLIRMRCCPSILRLTALSLTVLMATSCASIGPSAPQPPDLTGTKWLAEDIGGQGVMDFLQSTLQFDAMDNSRVGGNSGCNNYFGAVAVDGWTIEFSAMGSTRMACPAAVMDQENRFLSALSATNRYEWNPETDLLHFYDDDESTLRFSRIAP